MILPIFQQSELEERLKRKGDGLIDTARIVVFGFYGGADVCVDPEWP